MGRGRKTEERLGEGTDDGYWKRGRQIKRRRYKYPTINTDKYRMNEEDCKYVEENRERDRLEEVCLGILGREGWEMNINKDM